MSASDQSVLERPLYFGPKDRPCFGWLALPADGTALGGVLIAPTLGREARASRRALRELSRSCAARGLAAIRFDYDGTGDSAGGTDDPGRDVAFVDSVHHAAEVLGQLGVPRRFGVGMRLGAAVLGCAADRGLDLDALVLWDPCESGRTYLRELAALESLRKDAPPSGDDGSVRTAEIVFSAATVAELRRLDLGAVSRAPLAPRILALLRGDRPGAERLRERLAAQPVDWQTTDEQGGLLDVDPLFATLPSATIDRICGWLRADAAEQTEMTPLADRTETSILLGEVSVRERCVELGQRRLFGIVDEPVDVAAGGPSVVLLNVSNEDHTGPSRLWVELSRRWAARGLRCVRFDLTGIGDSPSASEVDGTSIYHQAWAEDTTAVATALSAADPSNVVFVGLCSGAYWAVAAGLATSARGVCAVNPPVGIDFLYGVLRLGSSSHRAVRSLAERLKQLALHLRWVAVVLGKIARFVMPSIFSVNVMRQLADSGTDLFVLASDDDLTPSPRLRRFARFFSPRLVAPVHYEVTFVPGLDHSLHDPIGRARAIDLIDRHVLSRFAPGGHPDDESKEPQ